MVLRYFFGVCTVVLGFTQHAAASSPADTTRKFYPSQVILLADTSRKAAREAQAERFYQNLRNTFYRRKLTRQLFDLVFDDNPNSNKRSYVEPLQNEFEQYEGKYIGEIKLKSLDLFGPTVYDTTRQAERWYTRTGNRFHTDTRRWVIQKNLLFETGQPLEPEQLADNERLLRNLNFIRDARIIITSRASTTDTVDITVITQDFFPLEIGGSRGGLGDYSLNVGNNNVLGIGHQLSNSLIYTSNRSPTWGYAGSYLVQNVLGTFADARLEVKHYPILRGANVSVQRPFFTPETHWAGGVQVQRYKKLEFLTYLDSARDSEVRYQSDHMLAWGGRAFHLFNRTRFGEGRTNLVVALKGIRSINANPRYTSNNETEEPVEDSEFFVDKRIFMGSLGVSRQLFRRDRYIYGFGRTEDVPLGAFFNAIYGSESLPQTTQPFYQLSGAWGGHRDNLGYVFARADFTRFTQTASVGTRQLQHLNLTYISDLLRSRGYRVRQVLRADAMSGRNRLSYEYLTIGEEQIPGARGAFARGTQRLSIHAETVVFTPYQLLGFQFAGLAFADLAWINNNDDFLSWRGNKVQGFGAGIRVRNENLVFKTFELKATIYPEGSGLSRQFFIELSGLSLSRFMNFRLGEPILYPFR